MSADKQKAKENKYKKRNDRVDLQAMGIKIDTITDEQVKYLNSWQEYTYDYYLSCD